MLDIERLRAETPGVRDTVHLLACGSALMPRPVVDAVVGHTELEARIGGYEARARHAEKLDAVYDHVAALIGASRHEIALVENATAAWCHAFYALPLEPGDRILTSQAEYAANYVAFLQRRRRDGIVIEVIPNDADDALDASALEAMLDERVALIAITWVPTNGGLVNPARAVGEIARKHAIPYLLDACQAVGQMPVEVNDLGCDFLAATGRKFLRGPRGTGFLYVAQRWIDRLEPVVIDHFAAPWVSRDAYRLRGDARRFETWENSYALRAGLGAAVQYAAGLGLEAIRDRAWGLAERLRAGIAGLGGARVLDAGREHCAIVSFSIDGLDPRQTVAALNGEGIVIGTSDPDSTRLDAEARGLPVLLRAAPHYYNTPAEVDRLVEALGVLARRR
jgi:selenocysteine lyase/cysteine desulfurase